MKHAYLLLILLLTSAINAQKNVVFSDKFQATSGKPYPVINGSKSYIKAGKYLLAVKHNGKELIMQRFEGEHPELAVTNTIDHKGILGLYKIKGSVYALYFESKGANTQLYRQEINVEQANFAGKEELLIDEPNEPKKNYSLLDVAMSTDSSKLVVTHVLEDDKNKDNSTVVVYSFDDNFKLLWKEQYQLPFKLFFTKSNCFVSNSGDVYWIYQVITTNSRDKVEKDIAPALKIVHANGGKQLRISDISTNLFIKSPRICQNKKNQILCYGYYESEYNKGITGIFTSDLSSTGTLNKQPIPAAVISAYTPPKKEVTTLSNSVFLDYKLLEDGSVLLIGEEIFTEAHSGVLVERPANFLVSKMNEKGVITWTQKVPRLVAGSLTEFFTVTTASATHILFFDNPKNALLTLDKTPESSDGTIMTSYRLNNETGAMTRYNVMNIGTFKGMSLVQFSKSRCIQLTDHSFVFEAYNRSNKEDVMVTVEIKD